VTESRAIGTAPAAAGARLPGIPALLAGQIGYQLRLLSRTPRALWLAIIAPGVLLALRLGGISHLGSHPRPGSPVFALVAGLAAFGLINTAFMTHAAGLVAARQDGVLRRWRLTPLPSSGYFAGRIVATVLLADVGGLVVVLIGVVMAGLQLSTGVVLALLAALTAGAIAWAAIGTAVTALVPSTEGTFAILGLVYLPVIFLSGAFGPFAGEPAWLARLVSYLPAQPLIDAVFAALRGAAAGPGLMPGRDLAVLAAWAVAGLLLSVWFFRWNPQRPSRGRRARP
jgi:ABC-2 type transport system permease protein